MNKTTKKTADEAASMAARKAGIKTTSKTAYKTEWDFSSLYKSPSDPKLDTDSEHIEKLCLAFHKKYSGDKSYMTDEGKLLQALKDWEKLTGEIGNAKPLWYLGHMKSIKSEDTKITAKSDFLESRLTKAFNQIIFFNIDLGKIKPEDQKVFLNGKDLAHYQYLLKHIFDNAKYNLSEEVEKVLSLMSQPSYSMWVDRFETLASQQVVSFKGKKIPFSEAMNMIHQLPLKDRHALHKACMEVSKSVAYFAESEINAIYTKKKIDDELRGFKHPYSATILGYENVEKAIEALVETVNKNRKVSHKFYKLKAKLLGLKELTYADRAIGIGKKQREVNLEECIELIRESFQKADPKYREIFDGMLQGGQIDVYPKKGKRGGAYCSGGIGVPTIVLLNYIPSIDAVMTMAHEMGHAIHTELSKAPSPIYQHYTISVAEVASTFFENLAFEAIYERLPDDEKIILLYDRIADFIQTVFRQIACFNFELALHTEIRAKGSITKEEIAALHNKNMSAYLGPAVKMQELDGYFFTSWSHIRNFFYVYSYAYGAIISNALYKKYKEDHSYIEKVNAFMKAGSSMSPEDIFKNAGIDTSKPEFFEEGIRAVEKDMERLEKLLNARARGSKSTKAKSGGKGDGKNKGGKKAK